ncbi:MAG: PAS domain-containing sensor histidine kinase [Scytonematopsis contorta HA4267-MV1]|nr:PAS domain-containing sensor histidine kinase [Scytonematopsis contorta HA4267-MV1]
MNFEFDILNEFDSEPGLQPLNELNFADFLINNAVDASFCVEVEGQFIYVNNATCLMTEYSREELLTMTLQHIEIDCSTEIWLERCQKLKHGKPFSIKSCYYTKEGNAVPVFVTLNYVKSQEKEFICGFAKLQPNKVVNIKDKTNSTSRPLPDKKVSAEYKKKEAELENSLSILRSTLESSANGIMAINFEGDILYCNQKFIKMWEIPTSLIIHKKCPRCKIFFQSKVKDPNTFLRIVWEISGQSDFESYDNIELNDGRTFAHYSEPQWVDGKIIGRVWSVWDITESRSTEEALRLNEVRFRSLAETTEASIFLIQGKQLCYINPAGERITGYTREELLSNFDLRQLIKNKKLRYVDNKENQLARSEYREMQILTKYGVELWLGCNVKVISGGVDFIGQNVELITAIDITDYKRAESELHLALEQAKQLSELRARFVSMVCHQFRTPLNVVSFSNSLLKKNVGRWSPEKKLPLIERIQTSVQQISQLLDEILLLGKVEAASLKSEAEPIELNCFCEDLIAKIELNHMQSLIKFNHEESNFIFRIDKTLLGLILTNLLDNAIKYSRGNSTVNFSLYNQSNAAVFKIQDTGIGIPEADQERLFQPFYRGSNVDSLPGTGLGLSIVKTLVDLHGGEICIESEVNVGTTFTVILPSIE